MGLFVFLNYEEVSERKKSFRQQWVEDTDCLQSEILHGTRKDGIQIWVTDERKNRRQKDGAAEICGSGCHG